MKHSLYQRPNQKINSNPGRLVSKQIYSSPIPQRPKVISTRIYKSPVPCKPNQTWNFTSRRYQKNKSPSPYIQRTNYAPLTSRTISKKKMNLNSNIWVRNTKVTETKQNQNVPRFPPNVIYSSSYGNKNTLGGIRGTSPFISNFSGKLTGTQSRLVASKSQRLLGKGPNSLIVPKPSNGLDSVKKARPRNMKYNFGSQIKNSEYNNQASSSNYFHTHKINSNYPKSPRIERANQNEYNLVDNRKFQRKKINGSLRHQNSTNYFSGIIKQKHKCKISKREKNEKSTKRSIIHKNSSSNSITNYSDFGTTSIYSVSNSVAKNDMVSIKTIDSKIVNLDKASVTPQKGMVQSIVFQDTSFSQLNEYNMPRSNIRSNGSNMVQSTVWSKTPKISSGAFKKNTILKQSHVVGCDVQVPRSKHYLKKSSYRPSTAFLDSMKKSRVINIMDLENYTKQPEKKVELATTTKEDSLKYVRKKKSIQKISKVKMQIQKESNEKTVEKLTSNENNAEIKNVSKLTESTANKENKKESIVKSKKKHEGFFDIYSMEQITSMITLNTKLVEKEKIESKNSEKIKKTETKKKMEKEVMNNLEENKKQISKELQKIQNKIESQGSGEKEIESLKKNNLVKDEFKKIDIEKPTKTKISEVEKKKQNKHEKINFDVFNINKEEKSINQNIEQKNAQPVDLKIEENKKQSDLEKKNEPIKIKETNEENEEKKKQLNNHLNFSKRSELESFLLFKQDQENFDNFDDSKISNIKGNLNETLNDSMYHQILNFKFN